MIIDIHTHIAGVNYQHTGNYLSKRLLSILPFRIFIRSLGFTKHDIDTGDIDQRFAEKMINWLNESHLDKAVFLAYDAVYTEQGEINWDQTHMLVSNDHIAQIAKKNSKVLFGASVHPYRQDAIQELERVIKEGACLIKWLPTGQNIDLNHPKSIAFYEALKHYDIPLLCHTGQERALISLNDAMNDPLHLETAAKMGVTVIAAHCGSKSAFYEKCYFKKWEQLATKYENFYGDISAFGLPSRVFLLKKIKKRKDLMAKLLYGSDIPVPVISAAFFTHFGVKKALQLQFTSNPFDRALKTMQEINLCPDIFTRAESLLKNIT